MHETSRETFLCCISGLDVRNMGLIIALKNHDHLHRKVSLKYYKSKIFLQGQLAQIYFILCKITHGLLTKEPFNRPVVSSYTLTISLLNKNNLLYCSSWVFGPDVWWNNWVWNCWVLFTMQPLQEQLAAQFQSAIRLEMFVGEAPVTVRRKDWPCLHFFWFQWRYFTQDSPVMTIWC